MLNEGWCKVIAPRRKSVSAKNAWINSIKKQAQLIADEVQNLAPDEELVLVDSGCGNHISNPKRHFLQFLVRALVGQKAGQVFVTADESELSNQGEKCVRFMTQEKELCESVFQQSDVALPIFSVRKLGKTHRVVFANAHQNEGYIEHRTTGQRTKMLSKDGVYFVKIKLQPDRAPKNQVQAEHFARRMP